GAQKDPLGGHHVRSKSTYPSERSERAQPKTPTGGQKDPLGGHHVRSKSTYPSERSERAQPKTPTGGQKRRDGRGRLFSVSRTCWQTSEVTTGSSVATKLVVTVELDPVMKNARGSQFLIDQGANRCTHGHRGRIWTVAHRKCRASRALLPACGARGFR